MLYPVNRHSSSCSPPTTGLLYHSSQTDSQGLYSRQNPRANNALFRKSNIQQSMFPAPPPGVVAAKRSTMSPPGFATRPQAQRRTCTEPTRYTEAANFQSYHTHQARHSSPTSPSREDSVRQTEPPTSSYSAEESLSEFNFSPLTEANRMVATSVALSALMDEDEEVAVTDVDKRIREVELKALADHCSRPFLFSAISHHTNSRSSTPPSETGSNDLPAPIRSDLSAAAPAFQFKPKYTLPWEEAEAKKAGMDVQAYQKKQMFASQGVIFRPDAMSIDTTAQPQRTLSHSRSRSNIPSVVTGGKSNTFNLNTPTQQNGSFAKDERDTASEEEVFLALLPRPTSITPFPFKRPSFAEAMLLPPVSVNEDDKALKRNAMPTLAEISARYMDARTKRSEHEQACSDLRSKRFSVDSNDSLSEQESVSSCASVPTTPRKSRLPAFLQHRRSNSSSSDDIILYSPTKSVHFDFGNAPQTPQTLCPTLRVTPPSVESAPPVKAAYNRNSKLGGFMQVMLEDGEDAGVHEIVSEEHERKRLDMDILSTLPTITCTPATAPGIGISPLAALEAQVQQNRAVEKRQERAQFMMSTLQRRNRGPGVAV